MTFPPPAIALLFTAGLAALMAAVAWQRRTTPGGTPFALLMLALAEWSLGSAVEKATGDVSIQILCAKVEYLGVASVPVLWMLFAFGYTQQGGLTRVTHALLWVMPIITIALAATNESHGLVWSHIAPPSDGGSFLVFSHGPWFWIFAAYNYALLLAGTVVLARGILRFRHVYRRQVVAVFGGLAVPWVSNAIYLAGASPLAGLDLTPFGFTFTGLVCAWAIFRFQLFDLVPIARDAVIESMSDGVIVLDARDRVVDINPAAQRMIGAEAESPVGHRIGAFISAWPDLVTGLHAGVEHQAEVHLGGPAPRYLDVRMTPLRDHRGHTTGRLIHLRDITERKLLDELRDDLTHALVHDLRNPLAGISGSLEVLAENVSSPIQREMLSIARGNTQRMLGLVDSIMDVSRLEGGQLPLERQRVQLGALVAEVLQLQQPLATERRLRVVNKVPDDVPPLLVDPRLIVRVIHNLIDNAIKFTPDGGTIAVSAQATAADVTLSVRDSGSGIPSALQGRLFQKFVTGRGPHHGSGLGLAFCRLAVEAHGGRIGIEGSDSTGTTVAFTLPMVP